MFFLDLAKKRFSARKYTDKPVEKDKILAVLEAGRVAPSAVNNQPWHFIVITEEKMRQKMADVYHREWFRDVPVMIILCADHSQSWKRSDGKDHADIDVAIAADHMTLAATDLGLGTCWICNFNRDKCVQLFNLPDHIDPVVILSLGYPVESGDTNRHESKRKRTDEIVSWEGFTNKL